MDSDDPSEPITARTRRRFWLKLAAGLLFAILAYYVAFRFVVVTNDLTYRGPDFVVEYRYLDYPDHRSSVVQHACSSGRRTSPTASCDPDTGTSRDRFPMTDQSKRSRWKRRALVAFVLLLPVSYVLALGPFLVLINLIPEPPRSVVAHWISNVAYYPLGWLPDSSPIHDFIEWWCNDVWLPLVP